MVMAFAVGLFVGLPIGCVLREKGYARKMNQAYEIFFPVNDEKLSDKYKSKSTEFYNNLARGEADPRDFERYIYGGSYG